VEPARRRKLEQIQNLAGPLVGDLGDEGIGDDLARKHQRPRRLPGSFPGLGGKQCKFRPLAVGGERGV
jgi:hypothetical protein